MGPGWDCGGNLAIIAASAALDPWLCVSAFRRICLYRATVSVFPWALLSAWVEMVLSSRSNDYILTGLLSAGRRRSLVASASDA